MAGSSDGSGVLLWSSPERFGLCDSTHKRVDRWEEEGTWRQDQECHRIRGPHKVKPAGVGSPTV